MLHDLSTLDKTFETWCTINCVLGKDVHYGCIRGDLVTLWRRGYVQSENTPS